MTPKAMISPVFSAMPSELRKIPRWLLWKDAKVPYCATAVNSKASVTEPTTWAEFTQAQTAFEEGGYLGVGFVLNGDRIVGVDLDKCVHSGKPATAALGLMERIGCKYIELSPSGTGLRGFGYSDPIKGTRGLLDGVNVELYANGRYLTVTGHPIMQGPLVALPGFPEVAKASLEQDSVQSVRMMNLAIRSMETFQKGLLTLKRLRGNGEQRITIQHVNVGQQFEFAEGRVRLTLAVGDVQPMLNLIDCAADAVYLDGFSPALNPDMWSFATLQAMANHCRAGTTLASYTVALGVRESLQQLGFSVRKRAGLPPKRHRLEALL